MSYRDWLPSLWSDDKEDSHHPFHSLRKQIDAIFDDFGSDVAKLPSAVSVRSNVSETDDEIRITAELPGISMDDVDVSVTGNRITIKGEKKSEKEEEGRHYHRIERSSGSFQRMMTLPFEIDAGKVDAKCDNGVLTVIISKPEEAREKTKKIDIKSTS